MGAETITDLTFVPEHQVTAMAVEDWIRFEVCDQRIEIPVDGLHDHLLLNGKNYPLVERPMVGGALTIIGHDGVLSGYCEERLIFAVPVSYMENGFWIKPIT